MKDGIFIFIGLCAILAMGMAAYIGLEKAMGPKPTEGQLEVGY